MSESTPMQTLHGGFTKWDRAIFSLGDWRYRFYLATIVLASLSILILALRILSNRRRRVTTVEDGGSLDEKKHSLDTACSAYLGHNALTEASPYDPCNTSHHVIQRLQDQSLHEYLETILSDEPPSYAPNHSEDTSTPGPWCNFSYPDTTTQQISRDTVQSMHSDHDLRTWQRKTRQIYGV